ncbi:MAG: Thioredoxin reductase [candidate division WS6 bacterium GW2011_GWF2_39_15]|uniref:Thioredoxin reductase n=1 Tax=candidate division WS6 bacterium GW2011_GWF2_39_15 TaxID=1619100 RepID=A0A0G0MRE9_9BACT|nr:MAG: Thioredoxin reductase [candidate division WS6 bacterium GW2011_GWF2_39_15]
MNQTEKLIIIGGGPAGLAAALYASRAMLNPLVIEGLPAGGQLTLTSEVENYPGFPEGVLGPDLIKRFRDQAQKFGTRYITENVVSVKKDELFTVTISNGQTLQSRAVLVATGADAKWLGLESEQRLRGKGVSACATCDGFFFKDKEIAVVGGGDSAMEEATFLTRFASKVTIIHRRNEFRASKFMIEKAKNNPKIEFIVNAQVVEVLGENSVEGLRLEVVSGDGMKDEKVLNVQGLFLAIGHIPTTSFLKDTGVLLDEKGYIYNSDRVALEKHTDISDQFDFGFRYATNIKGLFAAGDCTDYEYRQAGTAIGMGIAAELEIEKYLNRN